MYKSKKIFLFIILQVFIILSGISYADEIVQNKKVYMIVADKLTLQDIDSMNNLKNISANGGYGLMNTKGANNANSSEGFLTINSSARAYGLSNYSTAFNLKGKKLSLYEKRVGFIEEDKYQVGNTELNRILSENEEKSYDAKIGALGDNIHNADLKTAIFGNSDTDELFFRMASLIPMDSKGLVDYGNVDNILLQDEGYPYGLKTDYDKILREIEKVKEEVSLIVIDTGDLKRLDLYNSYLNDEMFEYHRKNILNRMDGFIEELIKDADKDSMFILISPTIENQRLKSSKLSPILIWEKDELKSGTLRSGTTRRQGIVSNLDIAPTIAEFLDISKDNFVGHEISIEKINDNIEYVSELDKKTNLVSDLRSPYLKVYNVFTIITTIIAFTVIIMKKKFGKKHINIVEKLLLATLSIPTMLLILPLMNIENIYMYIFTSLILLIGIIILISITLKKENRLWILLLVSFLIILIDISTGSNLTKTSIMGYDPIMGARYFGIGNELVGVFLPSMMLSVVFLMNKFNNKLPMILLFISTVAIGHPNLGANVGGTISILFSSVIFVLLMLNVKLDIKKIIMILSGVVITVMIIGAIDIYINPNPTHLGQTILMILREGPISITSVIFRKLSINIKLIKISTWSKVLYTSLIFGTLILKKCENRVRNIYNKNKYLSLGLISLVSGSIIGLIVNDSGLLLASLSITFMIETIMYLVLVSSCNYEEN